MRRAITVLVLATTPFAACGGGELDRSAPTPMPIASSSSSAPAIVRTPDGCVVGKSDQAVLSKLGFTREDPNAVGHAPGFDIDGHAAARPDDMACFKPALIAPDGSLVENQLATLIPAVEGIVGNAVDGLIQGAINDGNLLILMKLDGAESLEDAPCVGFTVEIAQVTKPSLGTDKEIEGYQTYDFDPTSAVSTGKGKIVAGVLTVEPFELAIPIKIFDVSFVVHVHTARFRATIDPTSHHMDGVLGGSVEIQEIIDGVAPGAGVDKILPMIKLILHSSADMAPDADGQCTQISSALTFSTVPAFIRAELRFEPVPVPVHVSVHVNGHGRGHEARTGRLGNNPALQGLDTVVRP